MTATTPRPPIVIAQSDYDRITTLLDGLPDARQTQLDGLQDELERAELVDESALPGTVARMNSTITFLHEASNDTLERRLVYPGPDTTLPDAVSIFHPTGGALLGLSVGQVIDWTLPDGRKVQLKVLSVAT